MKVDRVQTLGIAALLVAVVAVLPLASSPAFAQIPPQLQADNSLFDFDNTLTGTNSTDMSFLIISGMSMVEGAEVTGVVMNSENEISVTITNENETGESDAVTIVAFTGTMDVMSMFSSGSMASLMNDSSFGNSSIAATDDGNNSGPSSNNDDDNGNDNRKLNDSGRDSVSDFDDFFTEDFDGDNNTAFANSMSPTSIFEDMKTGSTVVQQGWDSPQSIDVNLVGNTIDATPAEEPDTTFVFVMIVPYTEETAAQTNGEG